MGVSEADYQRRRLDELSRRQEDMAQQQALLATRVDAMERAGRTLMRNAAETRKKIRELEKKIERLPDRDEVRLIVTEGLLAAAGKWPPAAILLVGAALSLAVGIILAALGYVHVR